ncbi:MAG: hypothetical protein SGARI_003276 [Bacillariaceae sp.]
MLKSDTSSSGGFDVEAGGFGGVDLFLGEGTDLIGHFGEGTEGLGLIVVKEVLAFTEEANVRAFGGLDVIRVEHKREVVQLFVDCSTDGSYVLELVG